MQRTDVIPDTIPEDVDNIKFVSSWDELLSAEFSQSVNCFVLRRTFDVNVAAYLSEIENAYRENWGWGEQVKIRTAHEVGLVDVQSREARDVHEIVINDMQALTKAGAQKLHHVFESSVKPGQFDQHKPHHDRSHQDHIFIGYGMAPMRSAPHDEFIHDGGKFFHLPDENKSFSMGLFNVLRFKRANQENGENEKSTAFRHYGVDTHAKLFLSAAI